jgi:hypothetical protein
MEPGKAVSDEAGTLVGDGGGIPGKNAWAGCQLTQKSVTQSPKGDGLA